MNEMLLENYSMQKEKGENITLTNKRDDTHCYEVKFFLNQNNVLNTDYELKKDVSSILGIQTPDYKQMEIGFMDTDNKNIYHEGWILRYRRKKTKYELTYKKRYQINNNDIDSVLLQASKEGFDMSSQKFETEIDWGFEKKALNFSCEIEESLVDLSNTSLPSLQELQMLFTNNAPKQYTNWNRDGWGVEQINQAQVFGTVSAKKYEGEWNSIKTSIEIWSVCNNKDFIVEVSFKLKDDEATVTQQHSKLKDFLSTKSLLLESDFSKTEWVMKKCKPILNNI
jgi:uncharacterized protein YjbK